MKPFCYLSLALLLANLTVTVAQQKTTTITTVEQLERAFSKQMRIPRIMEDSCAGPFYTTAKFQYRNGEMSDSVILTGNVRPELQVEINKLVAIFRNSDLKQIFPAASQQNDFDIYLPFITHFEIKTCEGRISTEQKMSLLARDIKALRSKFPYYTLEGMEIICYTPIRCGWHLSPINSASDKH
ncbi:hypothetical protein ACE38W_15340 [Chitinophaga sp. Hz27]|uniref:hypothetical protein n=1 Tax=Chitinophaga sp. Hz27 TaxID=3347169 RepID=UPI0035DCB416